MSARILVWGAGAIGGTIGAALARKGEDIVFVDAAPDHVAAIRANGLNIVGPVEQGVTRAPAFTPAEITGSFDRILLCVKAQDTEAATHALLPHLAAGGYVVSVQNGLNERVIAAIVGAERTIGCFVNFGADYLEPGVVQHSGRGAVVVGEIDGARTPRIEALHALFRKFEERAILTANIWGYLWGKMIYGALLFATALTNESIADVFAIERYRPTLAQLAAEVSAVAAAEGVALESFDGFAPLAFAPGAAPAETARSFDEMVAHNRNSAKSHSGIWRDLAIRKRRTEADAQLGPVVEIGARHRIPTPLTARIIAIIHDIENGRSTLDLRHLDTLARIATAGGNA